MPEEPIQDIIDGIRSRLQTELDAQLGMITERHAYAVDRARQVAEAEAEQRWTARLESTEAEWALRLDADLTAARAEAEEAWKSKIESTRTEWSARLEQEVAAARADAERRIAAEAARARVEAEQAASEAAGASRRQLEETLQAERAQTRARDAERERVEREMEQALEAERQQSRAREGERERVERELSEARAALEAERQRIQQGVMAAPASGGDLDSERLLDAVRAIGDGGSLSDVLGLTAAAAAAEAPRAAVFVANGPQLEEWTVPQLAPLSTVPVRIAARDSGVLGQAMMDGGVHVSAADGTPAPAFAGLPQGRAAIAVPLKLGPQVVGVLYADEGRDGETPAGWREAVQILGRHASACLAFLTAARTAQAMRLMSDGAAAASPAGRTAEEQDQGARRYARLLVSEIKLYNEAAVRVGREKRDLLRRLKPEIDRAHRLYDERIAPSVPGRDACFQQELVQTLADGDPALLG